MEDYHGKSEGFRGVVIALDQDDDPDKAERPAEFRDAVAEQVQQSGIKAYWAWWDNAKGVDDAKQTGAKVEIPG